MLMLGASAAQAQYATGGSGLHKGRIFWVDWGSNGQNVFAGATVTRGFNIDSPASPANRLDITCTLSNATMPSAPPGTTAGLFVYTPGTWQGDGLDDLYNIGGFNAGVPGGSANSLSVGLRTPGGATIEFDFRCSATLGGQVFPLSGLVFADAEASGGVEYTAARLTEGGTLRVIDSISNCGLPATVTTQTVGGFQEVRLNNTGGSCEVNGTPSLRSGPALVGYIDGATAARVLTRGGGISAVAVGAVLELEFSEAVPASYGVASHVVTSNWSGGVATPNVNYVTRSNLATPTTSAPRLGPTLQPDGNADGPVGGSDVDALPKTTGPLGAGYAAVSARVTAGSPYVINGVSCIGPGSIAGWIDFNGNGVFDASERSGVQRCPPGQGVVNLSWTVPADYTPQASTYLRLRAGSQNADVANPTGVASGGEAEDYRLNLSADMSVNLAGLPNTATAGTPYSGTFTCTNNASSSQPAFGASCAATGLPPGVAVTGCVPAPPATIDPGGTIVCNVAGTPTASGSFTVTGTTGASNDAAAPNNTATLPITVAAASADMRATTSVPASAIAGEPVTVSGTCTNAGPNPAGTPTCALSGLPPGATQSCTPSPAPNPLAVNASITCTSTFPAPATGPLSIGTTAGSSTPDPTPANNTDTDPLPVTPRADMQAATSGFPSNPPAGSTVTGNVVCTNAGPSPAAAATCAVSGLPPGATVSCTPSTPVTSLAAGASISCAVSYTAPATGGVTVTGTAGSTTTDPNPANNTAQATQGVTPQADMTASVTVPGNVTAGQPVTVSGSCTNTGPSAAAAPTCSLAGLPSGATQTCTPSPAPNPLAVGASITCTSTFNAPASGALSITATAGTSTADPNASNNSDSETVAITPQADMAAAVSGFPASPAAGSTVTGTVTCTNTGPSAAASATCAVGGLPPGATVSCTPATPVPSLAVGAAISCAVSYTAPPSGTVTVTGTAGSATADPVAANNTASASQTPAARADMQAATTVPTSAVAGQPVTVSGTCTNAGPSAAAAPTCALSGLPPGATQTCTPSPAPNPLAAGGSISCTSTFNAPASGPLNITTTAGSSTTDPVAGNNTDTDPLAVSPRADMQAAVSGFPTTAAAGSTISGTVSCTNTGPSPAADPSCTVGTVPSGGTVTCTPAPAPNPLPVGGQISCAVSYTVPASGAVTVTGTAGSSTPDPVPANNGAQAIVGSVPQADMQAVVSAPPNVAAGQSVTVSGTCTNAGPSFAVAPTCTLTGLPAGATVSCNPSPTPNPLPSGGVVTCTSTFNAPASGPLSVTATTSTTTADPVPSNNTATAPIEITPQADMAAALSGFPSNPAAGSTVSGTLTCTNNGPSVASDASCVPSGLPPGATVTCTPPSPTANLGVGQAINCAISYTAPATGNVTIVGTAGSSTADPLSSNNVVNRVVGVTEQADLLATTTVPANVVAGQPVTVTGTCTNTGPSAASAPTCALSGLPAGATQSCTPSPAPNPLPVGSTLTCSSTFNAPASLGAGGALGITTTAGSSTADPLPANNVDIKPLAITPQADMVAVAAGFPSNPPAGTTATGTITCTNNGPSPAANPSCNVSSTPPGAVATCAPNPAPNPLAAGASITCNVSYVVPATGGITVTGTASSATPDPQPSNNVDQAATAVSPRADMQAAVTAPATVTAGQTVNVSGTCTNNGPSAAVGASCVLGGLPPGATQTCTPSPAPNPLAVGQAINCSASFVAPASGSLNITSTAGSTTADGVPANNTAAAPITITPQADMRAAVAGFPANPTAGSTATGTVTCSNAGPSAAANASCAVGGLPPGATVECTPATPVSSLGAGQAITCAVSYPVPPTGAVTVTGTAGTSTADPVPANNTASASQTIAAQADMRAATTVPPAATAGQAVTVSGTCTNTGPSPAAAPTCALSGLPAGATQTCTPAPAPNPLPVGSSITCSSTFPAPASLGLGGTLPITTTAGSTTADPLVNNNTDTEPLSVTPQADMAAAVSGFTENTAGAPASGSVTCTNNGPSPAPNPSCNVTVLPPNATVSCTPSPLPNPLPAGGAITCAVNYIVPATGGVTVTGVADSALADPTPANNSAQATTNVVPVADMRGVISAPAAANAGEPVTVTGTCTNGGPSPASSATCELSGLPPGASQSCTPSPAPDPLAAGSQVVCTSTFNAPASGTLSLSVSAGSVTADPTPANNSQSTPLVVAEQADMRAAVSGFPANPPAGSTVTGTVTCTNAGPSLAAAANCVVAGAPAGATITCSPSVPTTAPLGVGQSISCAVSYTAPLSAATVTITGTASSTTPDPAAGNNTASTSSAVAPRADMQATIAGLPANPAAGSTITGTATCRNNGPSPADAPSCVVSGLPPGGTSTCTPTPAPNPLPVGGQISCAISFTVPASGSVAVQAAAGTSTTDPVPGNNVAAQPVSVSPVADMAATLAGFPANATAGVPVSGTLTCTNNGPSPAADATCAVGGVPAGATVSCTPSPAPNPLPVGAAITCAIRYTPNASGAVTVNGTAGSSTFDPNRANNSASATTGVIDAVNDSATLPNGRAAQVAVPNVLANDTLNGNPATLANVTLRQVSTSNPNVTLDATTGAVNVAANTPAGTYTVDYEICTRTTPTVCDPATATVTVGQAPIDAVNDPQAVVGPTGGTVPILANDTLAGAPVTADQVNITVTNPGGLTGLTIDPQGRLVLPPNTPPGSYTVTYQICERLNPTNCDTATVPVVVQAPIAGSVWFDSGATPRNREASETGLPGWTVEAVFPPGSPQAGQIVPALNGQPATAVTGADGSYQIPGLPPGSYQLRFRAPGVGGQPGAAYGTPVNGETGNPQPGSTVNTAQRVLDITVPAGGGLTQQSLPVDPSGVLYDAVTRAPVTGATVRLIGPNGQPVPADQLLPNQQNQPVIASGPAAGSYRFDLLPNAPRGTYRIEVTPPSGYSVPSALLPPQPRLAFQAGPGVFPVVPGATAPPTGSPTTYHLEIETGPGSADIVHNHIPLDPAVLPQLAIQKTANVNEAEVGDLVRYSIQVRNLSTTSAVPSVNVFDTLPLGFRLVPGTVRGAGTPPVALPNPAGSPGPALTFGLGTLNPGQQVEFSYHVRLGTASTEGDGTNRAFAQSGAIRSLTAQAKVKVGGGVFRAEACFVGKIYADCGNAVGQGNGNGIQDAGEPGIPGVRIYLEDGTYVISDSEGKYSYCGLTPRTRVLKVDDTTLPPGTRLGTTSNRNAGDPGSLFLDLKKGEVVQADFRDMSCKPSVAAEIERRRNELKKQRNGDVNEAQLEGDRPAGPGLGQDRSRYRATPTPAPAQKGGAQ